MSAGPTAGLPPVLRFAGGALRALDQTRLPAAEVELTLSSATDVAEAIGRLSIRGAPLIGVAAAYGLALDLRRAGDDATLARAAAVLTGARPTAVDLTWAVAGARRALEPLKAADRGAAALAWAEDLHERQRAASLAMGRHGADLLAGRRRLLTHCNTGSLAAPGDGTALAVIAELARRDLVDTVLVDESRPLLQGARLTVYELARRGIAHELIVDSAAAGLILGGEVDAVLVGCDRVAANGDVANKVGTVGLALAARAAAIPFVVVGPTSTLDVGTPDGPSIVIEQRAAEEVRGGGPTVVTLPGTPVRNPAFDVTPAELVTALVTERGVLSPPAPDGIADLLGAGTRGAR